MDAHFNEYLAAIAGMADVYGAPNDGFAAKFGPADGDLGTSASEVAAVVEQR